MPEHVSPCLCPQQLWTYNNNHGTEKPSKACMTVWGLHYPAANSTDTQAAPAPTRQAHVRQNLTPGAPWSKPRPLGEQHTQAVCMAAISVDRATLRRDTAQAQCVRSPAHTLQREGRNVVTPELALGGQADTEHG